MEPQIGRAVFLGGPLDWQDMQLPLAHSIVHAGVEYILGSWTDDASGFVVPCYAMQGMKVSEIERRVQELLWALVELPEDLDENRFWVAKGLIDAWDCFKGSLADLIVERGIKLKEDKGQLWNGRFTS
jgi:hypothetical protein